MKLTRRSHSIPVPNRDFGPIVMRMARPGDTRALEQLAQLDSHVPLEGPVLIAEAAGEPRAARSLRTAETIADPFHHTGHLRDLLAARAAQIAPATRRSRAFAPGPARLYARAEAR